MTRPALDGVDGLDALLKAIARDAGDEAVAHLDSACSEVVAKRRSMRNSLRNSIFNGLVSTFAKMREGEDALRALLADRATHRRRMARMRRLIDETDWERLRAERAARPPKDETAEDLRDVLFGADDGAAA